MALGHQGLGQSKRTRCPNAPDDLGLICREVCPATASPWHVLHSRDTSNLDGEGGHLGVGKRIQLYIYVLFFRFFSLIGSYRILSMILCAIQ